MLSKAASDSLAAFDSISVGSGAGIAASCRRGSIRREPKFETFTNALIFFNNSGNFWVPLRMYSYIFLYCHILITFCSKFINLPKLDFVYFTTLTCMYVCIYIYIYTYILFYVQPEDGS